MSVTADNFLSEALWAATTAGTVDWPKLREVGRMEPLTQRERCALLLDCVNGDALPASVWARMCGAKLELEGDDSVRISAPEAARMSLRAVLLLVIDSPDTAYRSNSVQANTDAILRDGVVVLPFFDPGRRGQEIGERIVARSPGEALLYALRLFLDPHLRWGALLRRCSWDACGRFAIGEPPRGSGQPPLHYCNKAHRENHDREKGVKRQRKHRKSRATAGSISK